MDFIFDAGTLEVILDRRLAQDDWRGLKEGVQDNVPTYSRFLLVVEPLKKISHVPVSYVATIMDDVDDDNDDDDGSNDDRSSTVLFTGVGLSKILGETKILRGKGGNN